MSLEAVQGEGTVQEDLESKPPLSAPVDKTASLTAELPAAYGQSGMPRTLEELSAHHVGYYH